MNAMKKSLCIALVACMGLSVPMRVHALNTKKTGIQLGLAAFVLAAGATVQNMEANTDEECKKSLIRRAILETVLSLGIIGTETLFFSLNNDIIDIPLKDLERAVAQTLAALGMGVTGIDEILKDIPGIGGILGGSHGRCLRNWLAGWISMYGLSKVPGTFSYKERFKNGKAVGVPAQAVIEAVEKADVAFGEALDDVKAGTEIATSRVRSGFQWVKSKAVSPL